MKTWKLTFNQFSPEEENLREALCALGNGYFGTRGAFCEMMGTKVHYPGTYIAGVYNTLPTEIASRTIYNEDFVNCPNWLMIIFRIDDGPWFDRKKVKILSYKTELNMKKGMFSRRIRYKDDQGRITLIEEHRIVSMAHPHCGAIRYSIMPENYDGKITVRSGIDGLILNAGVDRYKQLNAKHLEPASHGNFGDDGVYLQMQTTQSKIEITVAQRCLFYQGRELIKPDFQTITHGRQRIIQEFSVDAKQGQKYSLEKLISIYTSRDYGVADNCAIAQETAGQIENFDTLYKAHNAKWKSLWKHFDIKIDGDDFVQLTLRLHAFHLLQSASTYNEEIDAGMLVRGLHGEAYRGHIFWDELYVFPFYNLRAPEITRALLMYRYRRLGAAKENAKQAGFKGAMYPWQSASLGDEQTQEIHLNPLSGTWGPDYSALQRHVSIAVAYNVWIYYCTSADRDFLNRYGAEMILEISQFWASATEFNEETKRFEIKGVMGPDEFHEKNPGANAGGINNNAYTNVMVVWVIEKALHILDGLEEEEREALLLKVEITKDDLERFRQITEKMYVPIDSEGLIHQFDGYMDLEELNWDEYKRKYDDIHRVDRILKAEGLSPDSYKVAKQADVLMLFYILNEKELEGIFKRLGYSFNKKSLKKNYDYYYPRTSHGSTLSRVVHAYVAQNVGLSEDTLEHFNEALKSDIYDTQGGTTQEGIHAGVMGSTLDLFLRSFVGLSMPEGHLCLNPRLPKHWTRVEFSIQYKSIWFHITVGQDAVTVKADPLRNTALQSSSKILIEIRKKTYDLIPGKTHEISTRTLFLI